MALASRSTKSPSGGTAWVADDDLDATPLNGDIDNILTQLNGNIENVNISATADISGTKLLDGSLTNAKWSAAGGTTRLDASKVDDYSDTDTVQNTVSSPGTSASNTLATQLQTEIEQLRYEIRKLQTGVSAQITDGSTSGLASDGNAAWFDGAAIGVNQMQNPTFLNDDSGTPTRWSVSGTPAFTTVAMDRSEGHGKALNMATTASGHGISQSLTGVRKSSRYLVVTRIKPNTQGFTVDTLGGTGTFGNLALDSASGSSAWETIAGVVQTDATPNLLAVRILSASAGSSDCDISFIKCIPLDADFIERGPNYYTLQTTSTASVAGTIETDTLQKINCPGDGYQVRVTGHLVGNGAGLLEGAVEASTDDGVTWDVIASGADRSSTSSPMSAFMETEGYMAAGQDVWYRLTGASGGDLIVDNTVGDFSAGGRALVHRLTVTLTRIGG